MATKKGKDIMIALDSESSTPLYHQIYEQLAKAILDGVLVEGDKLPSIRGLAVNLGVSNPTVDKAYLQLTVEGYVTAVPRSGYRVNRLDRSYYEDAEEVADRKGTRGVGRIFPQDKKTGIFRKQCRYDFSYAFLAPGSFPTKTWADLAREAVLDSADDIAARYPDPSQPNDLQRELARYLSRTRGVQCDPRQVLVAPGSESAVTGIVPLFDREHDIIGCEEPGWITLVAVARREGFRLVPLPSDKGAGTFMRAVRETQPRVIFTTPSHQFPLGTVMPLSARIELLRWANENGAYIIEDDSCNEYRYDVSAIPSLYSLDAYNRVVYMGNFSKTLSPALRMAYTVLPPRLLKRRLERFPLTYCDVSGLTQATMARFIAGGHLDQQVRKMTTGNRQRHNKLVECLRSQMGEHIELSGVNAGMHLVATVKNGMSERELVESAEEQGAIVYTASEYWFESEPSGNQVLIGFSAIDLEDIPAGVAALKRAWFPASQPTAVS